MAVFAAHCEKTYWKKLLRLLDKTGILQSYSVYYDFISCTVGLMCSVLLIAKYLHVRVLETAWSIWFVLMQTLPYFDSDKKNCRSCIIFDVTLLSHLFDYQKYNSILVVTYWCSFAFTDSAWQLYHVAFKLICFLLRTVTPVNYYSRNVLYLHDAWCERMF